MRYIGEEIQPHLLEVRSFDLVFKQPVRKHIDASGHFTYLVGPVDARLAFVIAVRHVPCHFLHLLYGIGNAAGEHRCYDA